LGFTLDNKIFFFKVSPFGASFSAYHWTRLGSFLLLFHALLWFQHAGFLYVDDFLFMFPESVAWVLATPERGFTSLWCPNILGGKLRWDTVSIGLAGGSIFTLATWNFQLQNCLSSNIKDLLHSDFQEIFGKIIGIVELGYTAFFLDAMLVTDFVQRFIFDSSQPLQHQSWPLEASHQLSGRQPPVHQFSDRNRDSSR